MAVGKKTGGRKKGSRNKASVKRQAEVAASGKTPLDYMLDVLRDESNEPIVRFEAAKAAAPYVHPRLMAMKHSGDEENPVRIERIERVIVSSKNSDG